MSLSLVALSAERVSQTEYRREGIAERELRSGFRIEGVVDVA